MLNFTIDLHIIQGGFLILQNEGWIIYNGHLPSPVFLDHALVLQKAAQKHGLQTKIYKNNELLAFLTTDSVKILFNKGALPDFVIFTDKDIYLAKQLELMGIRLFNCARSIEISDDKIATYQHLVQHQINIPKTIIAPKLFTKPEQLDTNYVQSIINTFGFPMIIKEAFGSFGEQVYLVHNELELTQKVTRIGNKPFMFQEFIHSSYGKDLRLHVVGDEVAAAMMRSSKNDFRANVTAGGTMTPYEPSEIEMELAIAATAAIHADFAGVDLLFGPNGQPIVCEVNSNAHIRNLYDCTNINVADHMMQHIITTLANRSGDRS